MMIPDHTAARNGPRAPGRDIIVIGASAGGVDALQRLVAGLPPELPAAIFVVIHQPPWHRSELPSILSSKSPLPALQAEAEQPFLYGRIYVASPDYHLMIERECIQLWRGPKENRHRPAINTLFRSAAATHGRRVIGVILSGTLDDGTTGLWWIKKYGGLAIVQDPDEARFPEMPRSALEHVAVDYVVRLSEIGPLLGGLVTGNKSPHGARTPIEEHIPWKRNKY